MFRRSLVLLFVLAQPASPQQRWPFAPVPDDFSPDAVLDLRYLNESTAGESGFVRVNEHGDFVLGDGRPARFWAVNSEVLRTVPYAARPLWRRDTPSLERHARFLAKRGVNLIRLHAFLNPKRAGQAITDIDTAERDWIWRTVAAMKKEGIYTVISPYWANNMTVRPEWNIPDSADAHALLFFNTQLQNAYKSWLRALYAEVNPHTGIPLSQDPAVAVIQLQNEDSLLFWTINNLRGAQRRDLGARFYQWVLAKHGSIDRAREIWQNNRLPADNPDEGFLDFHNLFELTQPRTGGFSRRLADQLQFWVETMRAFNAGMVQFLREELSCRQLVNASNWRSGDFGRLEDAERYSYTAADVLATNRYYTGVHLGTNRTWAIGNGDQFTSPSILNNPRDFALNLKQVRGFPMMITESLWVPPMAYQAEAPLLVAGYQSLTGIDAYFWFSNIDEGFAPPQSANGFLPSLQKWSFNSPELLGGFPAAALLYRKEYVKRGDPVVVEHRSLNDLWERRTPIITEAPTYDPNRDSGDVAPASSVKSGVDPAAFFVGPVQLVPDSDAAQTTVADLQPYIDSAEVRSNTGELTLDTTKGHFKIDAPKAQGIAAFFKKEAAYEFADISLTAGHEYGSVLVVPLDDAPIRDSGRLLVQVGTQSRPANWEDRDSELTVNNQPMRGKTIVNFGQPPWQVVTADLKVTVRNIRLNKAFALDANGNRANELPLSAIEGGVQFQFPSGALYVVLEAR
jgi:hypothetical protein